MALEGTDVVVRRLLSPLVPSLEKKQLRHKWESLFFPGRAEGKLISGSQLDRDRKYSKYNF